MLADSPGVSSEHWDRLSAARILCLHRGNARGIDIIAYNGNGTYFMGILVKLSASEILCQLELRLISSEVKKRVHRGEKDGRISYWLKPTSYDWEEYGEAWDHNGHGE
jgi:hypothetical protein